MNINEKQSTIQLSIIFSIVFFACVILWLGGGDISMVVLGIVVPLIVIAGFWGFMRFMNQTHANLDNWLNTETTTPKALARAYGADYIDQFTYYTVERLGDTEKFAWSQTKTQRGHFVIRGNHLTIGDFAFSADDIQWFGHYKSSRSVIFSLNVDGWWYRVSIDPVNHDENFYEELHQRLPEKLKQSHYINRPEVHSESATFAQITSQNLQGIFEDYEAVELYVTPLWLVVIHNGYVIHQHFIDDIEDIQVRKHPTHLNDAMHLLTFSLDDETVMYALEDTSFVTRLSDASQQKITLSDGRKKKQADEAI